VQDWLTQSQRSQAIQAQNKAIAAKNAGLQNNPAPTSTASQIPAQTPSAQRTGPEATTASKPAVKLSYKEQRELDGLPGQIEALEEEQKQVRTALADSQLFVNDPAKATALYARDAQIDEELLAALDRWETLSSKSQPT
jgi:ATP-binding cassette subfamily F protein uup